MYCSHLSSDSSCCARIDHTSDLTDALICSPVTAPTKFRHALKNVLAFRRSKGVFMKVASMSSTNSHTVTASFFSMRASNACEFVMAGLARATSTP